MGTTKTQGRALRRLQNCPPMTPIVTPLLTLVWLCSVLLNFELVINYFLLLDISQNSVNEGNICHVTHVDGLLRYNTV